MNEKPPIKFDQESSDVNLARLEARASALPFAVGLCPDPSHAAEFYMPLTEEDVASEHMRKCPLDCPHELVVYRRLTMSQTPSEQSDSEPITAHEAMCIRVALAFGDPALENLADDNLERAKAKLLAIEKRGSRS